MNESLVQVEHDRPGVVVLTLNRPAKRNALNRPLMAAVCDAVAQAEARPDRRVLILRGGGPVFCAGLDLQEAREVSSAENAAHMVARLLKAVSQSRLITIAAVHGAAMAGGAGLMAACDLAVAADDARIGFPEVHRGLVPALIMRFVERQVGDRRARELLLLGSTIDAPKALEIGLLNRITPADRLMDESLALVDQALAAAPGAVERTKHLFEELARRSLDDDLQLALRHHLNARNSQEAAEGLQAFFEKRPPRWQQLHKPAAAGEEQDVC